MTPFTEEAKQIQRTDKETVSLLFLVMWCFYFNTVSNEKSGRTCRVLYRQWETRLYGSYYIKDQLHLCIYMANNIPHFE